MNAAFREVCLRHPAALVFAAGLLVPLSYAPWRLFFAFFFAYAVFSPWPGARTNRGTFVSHWLGVRFRAIAERPLLAGSCFSGRCRRISLGFAFCRHAVAGRFGAFCRRSRLAVGRGVSTPRSGGISVWRQIGWFFAIGFFGLPVRWRAVIS